MTMSLPGEAAAHEFAGEYACVLALARGVVAAACALTREISAARARLGGLHRRCTLAREVSADVVR
jgi:hypothetical protein